MTGTMTRTTVLSLALLVACSALTAADCDADQFQCKDGSQCIWTGYRCNHYNNCDDGSDEADELCSAIPRVALPANATVKATVHYTAEHGDVLLLLWGEQHCSMVLLRGLLTSSSSLANDVYTGCPLNGWNGCTLYSSEYDNTQVDFTDGEVVLEVQHQPGWLVAWREGRPDDVVAVPTDLGEYGSLWVKPWFWTSEMPVDFTVSTEEPSTTQAATTTD